MFGVFIIVEVVSKYSFVFVVSIVITSCNLAMKLNKDSIECCEAEGLIEVNIKLKDDIINTVFLNMLEMLEELSKQYKSNVKII